MSTHTASFGEQLVVLLPQLRAVARLLTRDPQEADDLVQDTLVRALAAEHQWQPGSDLRAWSLTILRRRFYERLRRARRRPTEALQPRMLEVSVAAGQEDSAALRQLGVALARLTPLLREALVLVGAQGLTYEEAATICEVPVGTMKARVSRARRELSRHVGVDASGDPKRVPSRVTEP